MSIRGQSQNTLYSHKDGEKGPIDLIKQTRKLVHGLNEKQRIQIAKRHLNDALSYKTPRLDTYSQNLTMLFKFCYRLQTSEYWTRFLLVLSYLYMYTIAIDTSEKLDIGFGFTTLFILWVDIAMEVYHKKFQVLRISSRFQTRFYIRFIILVLLVGDQFMEVFVKNESVRPLLVLRCILPIFYDSNTRKSLEAVLSGYKDIVVFLTFYTIVIVLFAIVANQVIYIPKDVKYDRYTNNYVSLSKTFFVLYVLSSYDAYPDNQLVAIQQSIWTYAVFIVFIIFNVFFFVTIPTSIFFNSFRETRSKILLIDEIKQQHSLIMCFVSLGEENLNISQEKMISFLLSVYKNKVRYVDYITEICLKLDHTNNGKIQVSEFMQLCKVLQANASMMPPSFHDWELWIRFRRFINSTLRLKAIIKSTPFAIVTSIIIILTFINCCLALYTRFRVFDILDDIFTGIFCLELLLKVLGLGPQDFFKSSWNTFDCILILISLGLEIAPADKSPHNSDVLSKMMRIFRMTMLIGILKSRNKISISSQVYLKSKKLISQMMIIFPVSLKFFPLYLISYYILGVLGMQFFTRDTGDTSEPYGFYNKYSNFSTFMGTQYFLVQVLVEAGWSTIAFNHAAKYGYYFLTMMYFVFSHIVIVIFLSSLLKGLIWEVYHTMHHELEDRKNEYRKTEMKELYLQKKKEDIEEIKQRNENQLLLPDNLITRELYENRIDIEIFKKIKAMGGRIQPLVSSRGTVNRSGMVSHLISDRHILIDEVEMKEVKEHASLSMATEDVIISKLMESLHLKDIEDLQEEDIEEEMEKFLSNLILHHKIKYSEAIVYPKVFTEFLERKLLPPYSNVVKNGFNIDKDVISNPNSVQFLIYELNVLLQIKNSERQQKSAIIKNMIANNIISQDIAAKLITKKLIDKDSGIDSHLILRKMFLSDTNEDLIKKFEIQYFSNVYGKSFKEINKVTIEPLLKLESRLTYCLRNALRYFQIREIDFFTILSTIQDTISNKLLKKGSMFKFVYQIDSLSDSWFSIELKESNELKIHFIKTGVWVYHKAMKHNEIRVGEDIFNWVIGDRSDKSHCEKYIKLFFQSFQSLAFSLLNHEKFFAPNPTRQIYDLFTFYRDVLNIKRLSHERLRVSKIMLVILSREEERESAAFEYELSDIKMGKQEEQSHKDLLFRFDESENETFKKLKNIELMDYDKIVETEGIPFTFIINMLTEMQEILQNHEQNLVYQVEKVLNREFDALPP